MDSGRNATAGALACRHLASALPALCSVRAACPAVPCHEAMALDPRHLSQVWLCVLRFEHSFSPRQRVFARSWPAERRTIFRRQPLRYPGCRGTRCTPPCAREARLWFNAARKDPEYRSRLSDGRCPPARPLLGERGPDVFETRRPLDLDTVRDCAVLQKYIWLGSAARA